MKILDIIRDANANLFRNKLRSFLTILAIFIGSFAIITNTAIQAGVNRFIDDQVDSYGGEGYIAIANKDTLDVMMNSTMRSSKEPQEYSADQNQTSATPITKEQLEKLKKLDVIKDGEVYQTKNLTVDYIASDKTDKKYLLTAEAIPAGEIHVESTAGVSPDNSNLNEDQIMITQSLVSVLGFESDEKNKPEKSRTKASFKIKHGKIKSRAEEIDGVPVYYPESYLQVRDFAEILKKGNPCIISIEYCEKPLAERILTYFEGVCFALSATRHEIEENKLYLYLPEGMEVEK